MRQEWSGRGGQSRSSSATGCARARRSPSRPRWRRSVRTGSARALGLELADGELDDGVLAMLGLDAAQAIDAVGEKREQLPAWEQLALAIERADAADDQAPLAERGLGDLGDRGPRLTHADRHFSMAIHRHFSMAIDICRLRRRDANVSRAQR